MASVYVRVFKSYGSPNNRQWSNTYELNDGGPVVEAGVSPTTFLSAAQQIADAERGLHLNVVYFNRFTISTWQPETGGYDPTSEVTVPMGNQGLNSTGGADALIEDLRIVLWIARKAATGRPGKVFYRGVLIESNVENVGGKMALTAGSSVFTLFNAYHTALASLFPASPTGVRLVLIGGTLNKALVTVHKAGFDTLQIRRTYGTPWHIRNLTDLVLQGATVRQTSSGYFDRP